MCFQGWVFLGCGSPLFLLLAPANLCHSVLGDSGFSRFDDVHNIIAFSCDRFSRWRLPYFSGFFNFYFLVLCCEEIFFAPLLPVFRGLIYRGDVARRRCCPCGILLFFCLFLSPFFLRWEVSSGCVFLGGFLFAYIAVILGRKLFGWAISDSGRLLAGGGRKVSFS